MKMKKILVCPSLLLIATLSFSQRVDSIQSPMRQTYLTRSKHQKTAGWILLGAGVASLGVGISLASTADDGFSGLDRAAAGIEVGGAGLLSTFSSIPFFMASARNKAKAAKLSTGLKMQPVIGPVQTGVVFRSMPALSLRLDF